MEEAKKKKRSIAQRLRDVRRVLKRVCALNILFCIPLFHHMLIPQPDLAATARVTQERILDALQKAQAEERNAQRQRNVVKKYRMVKFFGRLKCRCQF